MYAAAVAGQGGISRRSLLKRGGVLGLAMALSELPGALGAKGLLDDARALEPDVVADTFNGLVAFVLPGSDAYSVAQGASTGEPGGIAAGTVPVLMSNLDEYVPAAVGSSTTTIPASGGVAMLLNDYALQVNPAASSGQFLSPFARLKFAEKVEVFRRWEADPSLSGQVQEVRFVSGILPGFVAFLSFSEAGVLEGRRLRARPVGWILSRYSGPAEGHRELRGYYGRRRSVVRRRRRRRRRRGCRRAHRRRRRRRTHRRRRRRRR